ncbi:hypothetical protein ARSEF4850_007925 [Beauveria asiatica]
MGEPASASPRYHSHPPATKLVDNIGGVVDTGSPKNDGCANNGADGITLHVGGQLSDGAVTAAEMATSPDNMAWGSYRCGMRLSAFFNDTQEIDIELLSREFDFENNVYPVNLVMHNGNALWSGGPPTVDSPIVVSYVNAYFNSSDADEASKWEKKCSEAKVATCVIPDLGVENATTGGQFLSRQNSSTASARPQLAQGLLFALSWVLACLIFIVIGTGLVRLWQVSYKRRRYEKIGAVRSEQLRRCGLGDRHVDDVPFGAEALESGVGARGVWVALMNSINMAGQARRDGPSVAS